MYLRELLEMQNSQSHAQLLQPIRGRATYVLRARTRHAAYNGRGMPSNYSMNYSTVSVLLYNIYNSMRMSGDLVRAWGDCGHACGNDLLTRQRSLGRNDMMPRPRSGPPQAHFPLSALLDVLRAHRPRIGVAAGTACWAAHTRNATEHPNT